MQQGRARVVPGACRGAGTRHRADPAASTGTRASIAASGARP